MSDELEDYLEKREGAPSRTVAAASRSVSGGFLLVLAILAGVLWLRSRR